MRRNRHCRGQYKRPWKSILGKPGVTTKFLGALSTWCPRSVQPLINRRIFQCDLMWLPLNEPWTIRVVMGLGLKTRKLQEYRFFCGSQIYLCFRCQARWPRGLRRGVAAAGFLGLRVRIPPGTWMSVFSEYSVLSGCVLCVGLIARPEESYPLWRVQSVWSPSPVRGDHEPESGQRVTEKKKFSFFGQVWCCLFKFKPLNI